jgi:hypothetical protein
MSLERSDARTVSQEEAARAGTGRHKGEQGRAGDLLDLPKERPFPSHSTELSRIAANLVFTPFYEGKSSF